MDTPRRPMPLVVLLALLAAGRAGAATDPATPGPHAPGRVTREIPATGGATLTTDVHFPDDGAGGIDPAAGDCPLVVLGHGFSSSRQAHANQGAHLAGRGYVVLVPSFEGLSDHSRNADDISALITWALEQDATPASLLHGRLDREAVGVTGHSAGGLSSIVAAARDPRIRAIAPMDPVDSGGLGASLVATVAAPLLITLGEDSSCNAGGSARELYDAAGPIKRSVEIEGGSHCDPLDPSNFGCELVCGAASAARQALYRRCVTGWFEYWLRCDATSFDWVYGSHVQADAASGAVIVAADPDPGPLPCLVTPPPEVQGLRVRREAADVTFTWEAVPPPVVEYRIFRTDVLPFAPGPPRATSPFTDGRDAGAVDGTSTWFYLVRAANAAGEGP